MSLINYEIRVKELGKDSFRCVVLDRINKQIKKIVGYEYVLGEYKEVEESVNLDFYIVKKFNGDIKQVECGDVTEVYCKYDVSKIKKTECLNVFSDFYTVSYNYNKQVCLKMFKNDTYKNIFIDYSNTFFKNNSSYLDDIKECFYNSYSEEIPFIDSFIKIVSIYFLKVNNSLFNDICMLIIYNNNTYGANSIIESEYNKTFKGYISLHHLVFRDIVLAMAKLSKKYTPKFNK